MITNTETQLDSTPTNAVGKEYFTIDTDTSNIQQDIHTVKRCVFKDKNEIEVKWSRTFVTSKYAKYDLWHYEVDDLLYLRRVEDFDFRALVVIEGNTGVMIYTRYGRV